MSSSTYLQIEGINISVERIQKYGRTYAGGEFLGCVRKDYLAGKGYTAGRGDQNPALTYDAGYTFKTAKAATEWLTREAIAKGLLCKVENAHGHRSWQGSRFMDRLDAAKRAILGDERHDFHPSWFGTRRI